MDENKNNIIVVFTENADSVLLDIIKKFNLEETAEEVAKNFKEGRTPKIVIIDNLIQDFVGKIISEKEFIGSLKMKLEISQQTAEQISKEIISKLVPLLEKKEDIDEGEISQNPSESEVVQKIKPPTANPESPKFEKTLPQKAPTKTFKTAEEKSKLPKKPTIQQEQKSSPKGSDTYREPIE